LPKSFFAGIIEKIFFVIHFLCSMSSFSLKALSACFVVLVLFAGAGCSQPGTPAAPAVGPTGMFRSDDNGEKWREINSLPTAKGIQSLNKLKVYRTFNDPSDPDALYVSTRGQGLYYTYDLGETWRTAEALQNKFIYSVAVNFKDKCTIYTTDGASIFKTTDCTRTWKTVYTHQISTDNIVSVAIDYGNPDLLYALTRAGTVLVSTDGSDSWQTVKRLPFETVNLTSDPLVPRRIYVAGYEQGLVRSDDAGVTWKDLRKPLEKYADAKKFFRLVVHPSKKDTLFWVSKYGILRSSDAGVTWQELSLITAPGTVDIYAFGIDPTNDANLVFTGTTLGENNQPVRSTFYRSTDGGKSWVTKKLPTNTIPISMYIHPSGNGTLLMGFTLPD
jgi:photosystem II stability/assembly factor-like uncharacterized protein